MLSTLELSDSDFTNGNYSFTAPSGKAIAAPLQIKGARINIASNDFNGGQFAAFGGTVEVADGVTFSNIGQVELAAAATVSGLSYPDITSNANNTLTVSNIDTSGGTIDMQGGKIVLADAKITATDNFYAEAFSSGTGGKNYAAGGGITANHVNVSAGNEFKMAGKTVDLTTTIFFGMNDAKIIAADKADWNQNSGELTFSMTPNNTVTANTLKISDAKTASILGGKVDLTVADIGIKNTENKNDTWIAALPGATVNYSDGSTSPSFAGASGQSSAYALTAKDTQIKLETSGDNDPGITLAGGTVDLNHVQVDLTGGNDNAIAILAANGEGRTEAGNTVSIANSAITSKGERLEIVGNSITVDKESTISGPDKMALVASDNFVFDGNTNLPVATGTQGTISVSTDSKILQNGVDVTDKFATVRPAPAPSPSVDPTIPNGADDQENIASGRTVMNEVLASATSREALTDATRELVKSINNGSGDNRAKAAQVSGVLLAIQENKNLSDSEKVSLQREVSNTFAPTLNANTTGNNTTGSTTDLGTAAATGNTPNNLPPDSAPQNGNTNADTGTAANGGFTVG